MPFTPYTPVAGQNKHRSEAAGYNVEDGGTTLLAVMRDYLSFCSGRDGLLLKGRSCPDVALGGTG